MVATPAARAAAGAALALACLLLLALPLSQAKNPLVSHVGMADPHMHIFDGKAYIYSTHDTWASGQHGLGGCCTGDWSGSPPAPRPSPPVHPPNLLPRGYCTGGLHRLDLIGASGAGGSGRARTW